MNDNNNYSNNPGEYPDPDEILTSDFLVPPLNQPLNQTILVKSRSFLEKLMDFLEPEGWRSPPKWRRQPFSYLFTRSAREYNFYLVVSVTLLAIIILMIASTVHAIDAPNQVQVELDKTKTKFSSEKLNDKNSKKQKLKAMKKPMKEKEKKESANLFSYFREGVNNWWENKPLQREKKKVLQSVSKTRGGYQSLSYPLTYEGWKLSMDPVFVAIRLHQLQNVLSLDGEEMSQFSNISEKVSTKQKRLKWKNLFKKIKTSKKAFENLEKGFERLVGVVGFGITLRILTLTSDPLDKPLNLFDTKDLKDSVVRNWNYQDFLPQIPRSGKELKIELGNQVLVLQTKEQEPVGSLEVQNSVKQVNKEITPSVISKRRRVKIRRKKAKLMRFSDLPKMERKSSNQNEEIWSVPNLPERIDRISIKVQ